MEFILGLELGIFNEFKFVILLMLEDVGQLF